MFASRIFLPQAALRKVVEHRIADPDFALRAAATRIRRERMAPTGRLCIVAADHPARGVTRVGDDPFRMADRWDYLARVLRVLQCEDVDGVMATMDVIEDLLSIEAFSREAGTSMLAERLLIGSLNRGGLAGSCWELDDPVTGATAETCAAWRLDGAKMLVRVGNDDPGSLKTLLASADQITRCNALGLTMFLEPLPVVRSATGWSVVKTPEALARIAGVASALGDSSRRLWLKLPYCGGFDAVARSTTLPILLLGGESAGDPAPFLEEIAAALSAGPNVRGALAGRNVLYPGDKDPLAMAAAVSGIIHRGWTATRALEEFTAREKRDLDFLARHLPKGAIA